MSDKPALPKVMVTITRIDTLTTAGPVASRTMTYSMDPDVLPGMFGDWVQRTVKAMLEEPKGDTDGPG